MGSALGITGSPVGVTGSAEGTMSADAVGRVLSAGWGGFFSPRKDLAREMTIHTAAMISARETIPPITAST